MGDVAAEAMCEWLVVLVAAADGTDVGTFMGAGWAAEAAEALATGVCAAEVLVLGVFEVTLPLDSPCAREYENKYTN